MFSGRMITTSTANCSAEIIRLGEALKAADAVLIGAGAGLSTAAGLTYTGERFEKYFSDFIEKYGFTDMYSGGFFPFETPEEHWAYWSRYIYINRFEDTANDVYKKLLELVKDKDYFVLTTNVDHQFQKAGFDKNRLFYTQGDYGLFQCSVPCHSGTYDNEKIILRMFDEQENMSVPAELVPKCPKCGKPMTMNLRADDKFVQDEGWYKAAERYDNFIRTRGGTKILLLELGVGYNTPVIIKFPFWKITAGNPNAVYACVNKGEAVCPEEIMEQSVCLNMDIFEVIKKLM
ncbi:MAG: Sir2 silent information regulator family NAD-dependent deacetylase [Oscillospiraceae bacterium]|nr:Sir2 silent information regulator family NAD-dependent deacetylase [Oscillospiraceae bacterium]